MHRSLSLRIAMLLFVVCLTTAPAFAAGKREDSPIGQIARVVKQIIKKLVPLDVPMAQPPL